MGSTKCDHEGHTRSCTNREGPCDLEESPLKDSGTGTVYKEAIYQYCLLRIKSNRLKAAAVAANEAAQQAELEMQHAWQTTCKGAPEGIYAFKELGWRALVVKNHCDYPDLIDIVR